MVNGTRKLVGALLFFVMSGLPALADGLFQSVASPPAPEAAAFAPHIAASRSRIVEIDHSYLSARIAPTGMDQAADRLAQLPPQDSVRLELFEGVVLDFAPSSITEAYGGGYIWTGRTDGEMPAWVSLVIRNGRIVGHVEVMGPEPVNYQIEPAMTGSLHRISELDGAGFPPEMHPLEDADASDGDQGHFHPPGHSPQHGNRRWNGTRPASLLDPAADTAIAQIDVLIPYTQAAANAVADIEAVANQAISLSNIGFENSGVHIRFRLVGTHLVSGYSELGGVNGYSQMLDDLTDAVGPFQTVHNRRDSLGADLVGMLVRADDVCGVGWVPPMPSAQTARLGFSLTTVSCVSNHTFVHETGHNMGLHHDRFVLNTSPPNSQYQYGHVDLTGRFYTVMAYRNRCQAAGVTCTRLNQFSNPQISVSGRPTGIAQNSQGAADAARWLNEVRHIIAAYRTGGGGTTEGVATSTTLQGPSSSNRGESVTFTATVRSSGTDQAGAPVHLAADEPSAPPARSPGVQSSLDEMMALPDSGQVVVKFREGLRVRMAADGGLTGLPAPELPSLNEAFGSAGLLSAAIRPMIDLPEAGLDAAGLDQMRADGEAASGLELADMNNYYIIDVPEGETAGELAHRLGQLPSVEFAEPVPMPPPLPQTGGATPDFTGQQGYVNAAPTGIGTGTLGSLAGITGSGIRVVDIEYSWQRDHEDLQLASNRVINVGAPAVDPFNSTDHGTAVMGQLVGLQNSFGVTGIVHQATGMMAGANTTQGYNLAQAIMASVNATSSGDVILLEQQTLACGFTSGNRFGPSEWSQAVYDATRAATAAGRVVVAAAGNGSLDLDAASCQNRFNRQMRDSGAIIVGAGSSSNRSRLDFSSFGSRVDVQGWGHNVTTTGYGALFNGGNNVRRFYTDSFNGTSSASPIVAGAAVAIQGRLRACNRTLLTSVQMRTLLRNTGSAQTGSGQIGPLPNVPAALDQLGIRTSCDTPNNNTPTGTVRFLRGGTEIGTAQLNASGVASLSLSSLPVGSHQITAQYVGATGFRSSTSSALTHVVSESGTTTPPNNLFSNRITISGPGRVTGSNVNATREDGQPTIATSNSTNAVWWRYTAPADGTLTIDTFGSNYDTTLAVFTGSQVNNLTLVQANDDAGGGLQSRVQFQARSGVQYQIAVAGWSNRSGSITLNLAFSPTSGNMITTSSLSGPSVGSEGQELTFTATVRSTGGTPGGTVSFRRSGNQFATATLNSEGVARVTTRNLPVGNHQITARYQGNNSYRASTSSVLQVRINPDGTGARPLIGGGTIFGQTSQCQNAYGSVPLAVTVAYTPSELFGLPSGLTLAWPAGSEHLSLWGAMTPSGDFLGAAGRQTWSRFVFYPNRPRMRVVLRQITLPSGTSNIADAREVVLRLRVQNFGSIPNCAVTISATLRRDG